jgi:hypothetical protein
MGHFDRLKMKNHECPKEAILVQTYSATVDLCTRYDRSRKPTYWKGVTDKGIAIVFGLVLDPKGLGELASLKLRMKQMHVLLAQMTPAVKAGLMFEVYPMPNAVVRK